MRKFSANLTRFFNYRYLKNNPILLIIFLLLLIGVYFVFSSTVVLSLEMYKTPYRFTILHLAWVGIGLIFFNIFYHLNLFKLRKVSIILYFLSITFLLVLSVSKIFPCESAPGFAPCKNGATRWLVLNPKPLPEIPFVGQISFQPSELAKLALILTLSYYFTKETLTFNQKLLKSTLIFLSIFFTVFFQPNKSTAFIMVFIFFSIYITYGYKLKYLLYSLPVFIILFLSFILINSYSLNRVKTFLDTNEDKNQNYHQDQIMISLGSGGFSGIGLGKSRQKFSFLPEIYSDSIFAIIGEEAGLVGSLIVIGLFFSFLYLGLKIALQQSEMYYRLLVVGIVSWVGVQSLINLFAMTDLIPLTGVPLPLISYGGSSTIFLMIALGILGNISRRVYERRV